MNGEGRLREIRERHKRIQRNLNIATILVALSAVNVAVWLILKFMNVLWT